MPAAQERPAFAPDAVPKPRRAALRQPRRVSPARLFAVVGGGLSTLGRAVCLTALFSLAWAGNAFAATSMQVVVTPSTTTFQSAGQVITYKYTFFNTGDTNIATPFAVTDTKVPGITCPATAPSGAARIRPMDTTEVPGITCTGSYTVTAADVTAGSISNNVTVATGAGGSVSATLSATSTTTITYSPLTVTNLSAPNLVVDSNKAALGQGPKVFTAGAKYCNQGATTLDNVFAKIGNGTTAGSFPVTACPTGTAAGGGIPQLNCGGSGGGAKPYTGNFALSMVDATGQDANRYIGDLAPGQCKTVYWQIKYDLADAGGNELFGATGPVQDDIRWNYSLWATGNDSGTPRTAALKGYVMGRSEITASPNKINASGSSQTVAPNPTGPGQIVTVTYNNVDFSGAVSGFDAFENSGAGDGVYDTDFWFQPVGNSAGWNTSTFRLSKVEVTLRGSGSSSCGPGGAGMTFSRTDQWYFYHLSNLDAAGNPDTGGTYSCSGWRGDYTYTFIALDAGTSTLSPYQEAASGANNEKYNGDYCGDNAASDPAVCKIISSVNNGNPTLAKSVDKATALAGENLTYTVTYANTVAGTTVGQPDSGLPVRILDSVPANTTFVAGSATCPAPTPSPGAAPYCTVFYSTDGGTTWTDVQPAPSSVTTLRWDLTYALAGNSSGTVGFTVTSSPAYTGVTPNAATIHIADGPTLVSANASTTLGVNPPSIAKAFSPNTIAQGGTSVLTITLTNNNYGAATLSSNLVDTLPTGITLANASFGGTCTGTKSGTAGGNTITYAAGGTIPAGNPGTGTPGSCTITANVTGSTPGSYLNTIAAGALVTNKGNNPNPTSDTLTISGPPTVAKAFSPNSIAVGGSSVLTITLSNTNPTVATLTANLVDTLPANVTLLDNTFGGTCTGTKSGTAGGNTVTYAAGGTIPASGSCTITANVTSGVAGSYLNTIPTGALQTDKGNNANPASDTLTVATPVVDLSITKTDGVTSVNAGGTTTYTIAVSNAGPSEVTGAVVADIPPSGLSFTGWTCAVTTPGSGGSVTTACGAASGGAGNLNTTANLKVGATVTYTVNAAVSGSATGNLVNTATVTAPGGTSEPNTGNNSATDPDTVTPVADLVITKTDGVSTVNAGGATVYTITVTNNGPSEVSNATVTDTAPAGVSFGAWTCAVTTPGSGGTVTTACGAASGNGNLNTTATLKVGGAVTYTVNASIANWATGSLTNTATVAQPGGTTDPTPANNSASDTDTVVATYSIGNYVWNDANHDGIQDAAEAGIAGVAVTLYAADGTTLLQSTYADGSGFYRFDGLVNGNYVVKFTPPAGYQLTAQNQGTGPLAGSFDSNPNPATTAAAVTIAGASDMTVDAGMYLSSGDAPARVADFVWYDTDHDGVQDAGEPGLGGVTVSLYADADQNGVPDGPGLASTVSDGNGFYEFAGLPAGHYVVQFSQPAGSGYTRSPALQGGDTAKDSNANASTGFTASINLAAGQNLATVDAGLYLTGSAPNDPAASISNFVWYDSNGDGIQDGGEPGIPGVVVRLYDAAGTTLLASTQTDPTGQYVFAGLAAGSYTVEFAKPNASYAFSPTGQGTAATDSDPDTVSGRVSVSLTAGQVRTDIDAGLSVSGQSPISIGDYVWKDANGNNTQDPSEGLANVQVVLYDSLGNELARLTTDASNANYSFTGVPAGGSYRVAVDTSTLNPANLVQIADPDAALDHRTDLISQTASTTTADFGYLAPIPSVSIVKTAADGSDSQQLRNPGTANFKVTVTNTGNVTLSNLTVTDPLAPDCAQTIASLAPGASSAVHSCALAGVIADLTNTASVSGQPVDGNGNPIGSPVTASDTSAVDVINPAVSIAKTATNSPVVSGDAASFSLTVTNTGDVALANVTVADPLAPACAKTYASLAVGASDTYTCSLANVTASFTNTATVTGTPPVGPDVTDSASAPVQVLTPGLSISKTPDSQTVHKGDTVSFTITVSNTGQTTLNPVQVADALAPNCDRANVGPLAAGTDTSYTCTLANVQASFTNTATATSGPLSASDVADVTVIDPKLSIVKLTNGSDGPVLHKDSLVTWSYLVSNIGDVPLTAVGVTDNQGVAVSCPQSTLAVAASMTCHAYGPAIAGPYSNIGTVTGTPPSGPAVSATDPSSYTGLNPGVIGNYVWLDENGDGVQDAGEAGIANTKVELKDAAGTTVIATTYTDANGGYLFAGVPAGSYKVVVTPAAGLNPTYNEDTGTTAPDSETAVTLAAGEQHLSADFGYNWVAPADSTNPNASTTGAIGDTVWNDANGNGIQDAGEAGIGGVTVKLRTDANGDGVYETVAATTATDFAGHYIFDGLPAGAYVVEVDSASLPAGPSWTQTGDPDGAGSADGKTTNPVVLAPGDVFVNADFGYRPNQGSSIGDTVWFDADADGLQDVGEPGIAGVSVALRDSNGHTLATAVTDAAGQYLFTGLPAGSYTVAVTDTANVLGQTQQSGDPDASKDGQGSVTANGTDSYLDLDFGYTAPGQETGKGLIGDTIFLDRDGSGGFNPGEGLQGVTVRLYASNGTSLLATASTDADGRYAFGGLNPADTYVVKVDTATLPNGGAGLANSIDPDGGTASQSTVDLSLSVGGIDLDQDFGYVANTPASLGGTLWNDSNADGILLNEAGRIGGVSVALRDANGDIVATTTTDANGDYLFTGLPAGSYSVDVTDTANRLEGWWHSLGSQNPATDNTSKADPFSVTLAAGASNTNIDFGYYDQGAALGNRLWFDANGNGVQNAGETAGPAGIPVRLVITYPLGGSTTVVVTTDASGGYRFGNLLLDESFNGQNANSPTYVISVPAAPAGYLPSPQGQGTSLTDSNDPAGTAVTVQKGQTDTALLANPANESANAGYDFGYYSTATVSGHLYIDSNSNGDQDPGEPDLANVDVLITDGSGSQTVHSDANGNYTATVVAGSVTVDVQEADPQYPSGYTQTEGTDPTTLTATAGQDNDAGIDGYAPIGLTGTVTGHLYIDTNNNGHQDSGEPNLGGVDVFITDVNGGGQTVTSDAGGNYTATVPAGTTTANVDENDPQFPFGYSHSEGTDPTTVQAVAGTGTSIGIDGYAPQELLFGTVSGHLYIDTNGNHTQDPGEPNLANVDVLITDANGGTQTVTSDANGNYSATVIAGLTSANVDETDPQFPSGYTHSEGDDPTTVSAGALDDTDIGTDGYAPSAGQLGSVTGHLYIDSNGNGVQEPGEPNLPNVDVVITDSLGGTHRVPSDANGNYTAPGIPAGSATVDVDEADPQYPAGYTQTEGDDPTPVSVPAGGTANAGNDGYQPPVGVIGNRIWLDENGDGVQDPGEAGIPNLKVELRDATGATVLATTYTDADGGYLFANVPAGTAYQVKVYPTAGLNPTFDEDGTGSANTSAVPAFPAGTEYLTADFGYNWVAPTDSHNPTGSSTGAIGDTVWNDANGNGIQDAGESGIEGVTVRLRTDANGDGVYETVTATATTDAAGRYIFDGLPAAAYVVEVDSASLPAGPAWTQTGDPDGAGSADNQTTAPVVLAPGDVFVNADFGYQPSQGSAIGDRVYLDANGDGLDSGAGEPGIGGVSVALVKDLNGNQQWDAGEPVIATDVTDANGNYLFDGLPIGDYLAVVTDTAHVLGGLVQTGDPDGGNDGRSAVTTDGVNDNLTQDFGYAPLGHLPGAGLIGDTVFLDRNGNSAFDAGEGLEGVAVGLYDATGATLLATAYTNENGQYAFGGLNPADTYVVKVDTATLPNGGAGLANSVDPDGGAASQSTVDLGASAGGIDLAQDFGYVATAPNSLSGTVWKDANADGSLNEAGRIAGVTVELLDAAGNVVGVATTDANGNYGFTGLPDGTYTVHVTDTAGKLEGWWKTDGPADGSDNNSQPDPYSVTLSGGAANTTADFGYYNQGAALGNRVWNDADGDGIQDAGEAGLANVPVTLTITYPLGGSTTVATVTDGSGGYRFGNLLLDESFNGQNANSPTYVISAATPAGFSLSLLNQGGNSLTDSNDPAGAAATVLKGQTDTALLANPADEAANAGYDFGFVPPPVTGTVSGHLYIDTNHNGHQDPGEPNLANVDVVITDGSGPQTVTSDANGNYTATVESGPVTIDVDETDPQFPAGYDQTEGTDPNTVSATPGQDTPAGIDGYAPPAGLFGTVNGHLYIDSNHSGHQDPGEPNLANVDVLITDANGGTQTVASDASGNYTASVVAGPATANVQETDPQYPAGYVQSEGSDPTTVTAVAGTGTSIGIDGYAPPAGLLGTVSGHLYIDSNGDGVQNGGEPNLPNVDVIITDALGGTQTVASDANGNYTATVVAGPASADVQESDPQFPAGYAHTQGTDPTAATAVAGTDTSIGIDGYAPPSDLKIEKTASTPTPAVGLPFTYTLTVTNTQGRQTAPVQVVDYVPAGVKLTAADVGAGWSCAPALSANQPLQGGAGVTLVCDFAGTIPMGGSQVITLTAVPTAISGNLVNRATVTGDGDGQPPNTTSCAGTAADDCGQVPVTPKNPRIDLVKKVSLASGDETVAQDGKAQTGEKLTYTFTVSNRGDVSLRPVSLVDVQLDAGTLACAATTTQGYPFSLAAGSANTLRVNDSVVCTGKHTVTADEADEAHVENTATATGVTTLPGGEPDPAGTPVQSAANGIWDNLPPRENAGPQPESQLSLSKTAVHNDANGNHAFDQPETVTYTFIVRNIGAAAVSNIAVTDTQLQTQGITVSCPSTSLPLDNPATTGVDESVMTCTASAPYVLQAADVTAGRLVNTATATGLDPNGTPLKGTDTKVLNSGEPAAIALKKTAVLTDDADANGELTVDDTLTYTLVATNTGAVALTNVNVSDDLVGTALSCAPAQGSTLSPGASMVCKATHKVQDGEANPLDNTAHAYGTPTGRNVPVDASANHEVPYTVLATPPPLYTIGNMVWRDANNNGIQDAAELGISGVQVRLLLCDVAGTNCATAPQADGTPFADMVTVNGAYQFINVPQNTADQTYRVQVRSINFVSDSGGTRPLYASDSSAPATWEADFTAGSDGHDHGVGVTPQGVNPYVDSALTGILSNPFSLLGWPDATPFNQADFGFVAKPIAVAPDLVLVKTAGASSVQRGNRITYTLQATNAVGSGSVIKAPVVSDTLPTGMTAVLPITASGWNCAASTTKLVLCSYTGALPVVGGSNIGAAIVFQANVGATRPLGPVTNTATITKMTGEASLTNNTSAVTVNVTP